MLNAHHLLRRSLGVLVVAAVAAGLPLAPTVPQSALASAPGPVAAALTADALTAGNPPALADRLPATGASAQDPGAVTADATVVGATVAGPMDAATDARAATQDAQELAAAAARTAAAVRASRASQRLHLAAVRHAARVSALAAAKRRAAAAAAAVTPGDIAAEWARRALGRPYVWGASGPYAFDCSGLTMYAWGHAGVGLSHYSGSQWSEGRHVSRSQLRPGDIVFFGGDLHHVGIYIGDGLMIDAPQSGDVVRVHGVDRSDYAGAVRPG